MHGSSFAKAAPFGERFLRTKKPPYMGGTGYRNRHQTIYCNIMQTNPFLRIYCQERFRGSNVLAS